MKIFLKTVIVLLLPALAISQQFPADWVGSWKGQLEIYRGTQPAQVIPLELHIGERNENGNYAWTIVYMSRINPDSIMRDVRAYILMPVDSNKGQWIIDEQNSILLPARHAGDVLTSHFQVSRQWLMSQYVHDGESITFRIFAGSKDLEGGSGGGEYRGEQMPEVLVYPVQAVQKAVLKRE